MKPIPTLDSAGWIETPAQGADHLFANFITANYDQTNLYRGSIESFSYLIYKYGLSLALANEVQASLQRLFEPYFDALDCTVEYKEDPNGIGKDNEIALRISMIVTDGGRKYSLGKLLALSNNSLKSVNDFEVK